MCQYVKENVTENIACDGGGCFARILQHWKSFCVKTSEAEIKNRTGRKSMHKRKWH